MGEYSILISYFAFTILSWGVSTIGSLNLSRGQFLILAVNKQKFCMVCASVRDFRL